MHTDLNIYALVRDRERLREAHMAEGHRLRALADSHRSPEPDSLNSRRAITIRLRSIWHWFRPLRQAESRSVAAA